MNPLTRFSLRNTLVVGLLVVMVAIGGTYFGAKTPMETMPNVSLPIVTVLTIYPGASPEDVAEGISRPLQKAISGVQGLKQVNATSNENLSLVVAQFDFSKDVEKAQQQVTEAVGRVTLPDKVKAPTIARISMNSQPVLSYSFSSSAARSQLADLLSNKVKPALTGVPGVSNVAISGLTDDVAYIRLDEAKMRAANVSASDVTQALGLANISFPIGTAEVKGQSLPIKFSSHTTTIDDLRAIPLLSMPNATKMTSEAMSKLGATIGQLYAGMAQMGQGVEQLSAAVGKNMMATGLLVQIQQTQAALLESQQALANPATPEPVRAKAAESVAGAKAMLKALQQQLVTALGVPGARGGRGASTAAPGASSMRVQVPNAAPSTAPRSASLQLQGSAPAVKVVFLKDIATVEVAPPQSAAFTRTNGKLAVTVNVYKNDDANTVTVADGVAAKISELSAASPGVTMTRVQDSATAVRQSVSDMVREGLLGALFAVVVIAIFLGNVRATLISVVSIPLSILGTLILLPRFHITLNIMSLSGMAVAVGRIVDDSIVVIENIHRRVHEGTGYSRKLIGEAVGEVASAITASTITTVAVFVPLAFVGGMVGKFFVPFAVTVVACIVASLIVALTVVPAMSRLMFRGVKGSGVSHNPERKTALTRGYTALLTWALRHRAAVVSAAVALIILSVGLVPLVGVQFMPSSDSDMVVAKLALAPGTSLSKTDAEVRRFEKFLLTDPSMRKMVATVQSSVGDTSGSGGMFGGLQGENGASVSIRMKDAKYTKDAMPRLNRFLGVGNGAAVQNWTVGKQSMTGSSETIEVRIKGNDLGDLQHNAEAVAKVLRGMGELTSVKDNLAVTKPEIAVKVDSAKAAAKGLSPMIVAGTVRGALTYEKATTLKLGGKSIDVMVGVDRDPVKGIADLKALTVTGLAGAVKLGDVADITVQQGPATITERDGDRIAAISADIEAKSTIKVIREATKRLKDAADAGLMTKNVDYKVGGSNESISEGFSQMGIAMLTAIFLVLVTMLLGLGELQAAFSIMFSLPFAVTGALLALVLTGHAVSMSGMVGVLMLIGIVVTNAIVLMDRVLTNKRRGMKTQDALLEAGAVRLRPILMTAAATIMALLPLALGLAHGALVSTELGLVVIGGLTMSTLLTLVIVPVAYTILLGRSWNTKGVGALED